MVSQPCGHLRHSVHPRGALVMPHDKPGNHRETKQSDGSNDSAAPHGPSIRHEQRRGTISVIDLDDGSGRLSVVLQPQDTHALIKLVAVDSLSVDAHAGWLGRDA